MFFSSLHKLQLLTPGLGSFHRPWKHQHQHHQPLRAPGPGPAPRF